MAGKIVVYTSVIVKWLSAQDEKYLEQADKLLEDTQAGKIDLFSPELCKYEIGNALLKGKQLEIPQAFASLGTTYALPIQFIPESKDLAERSYEIGKEFDLTYYDASFLSLAESLKATLVSDNVKHQGKAVSIKIVPLSKYKVAEGKR